MTAPGQHARPRRFPASAAPVRQGPGARRALLTLAWLVPLGVLGQAALAGQALYVSPELFGLHGGLGHGVLLLAVVTAALAWIVGSSRPAAALASLAVIALIGQTGLGYVGHRSRVALASSLHIPLGVAILGLTVAVAVLVTVSRRPAVDAERDGLDGPGVG